MRGKWIWFAGISVAFAAVYWQREKVRTVNDFTDPLRYERRSWVGLPVDYRKEPLLAWTLVSGPKQIELSGGGTVQTCMDEHLLLGDAFEAPVPADLGEALDWCRALSGKR